MTESEQPPKPGRRTETESTAFDEGLDDPGRAAYFRSYGPDGNLKVDRIIRRDPKRRRMTSND